MNAVLLGGAAATPERQGQDPLDSNQMLSRCSQKMIFSVTANLGMGVRAVQGAVGGRGQGGLMD